jgi:hypothetical protein
MNGIRLSGFMINCVMPGVPSAASGQADPKRLSTSLGMVVFPAKGQTGVDPMAPPQAPTQAAQQPAGASTPKGYTVK